MIILDGIKSCLTDDNLRWNQLVFSDTEWWWWSSLTGGESKPTREGEFFSLNFPSLSLKTKRKHDLGIRCVPIHLYQPTVQSDTFSLDSRYNTD